MIVGIGVDVVDLARFEQMVDRTPHLLDRLFTTAEQTGAGGRIASLAAAFAAKEAVAKALGAPRGLQWSDVECVHEPSGRPRLVVTGAAASVATTAGIGHWHVSLSHDAGTAVAMVVAESLS